MTWSKEYEAIVPDGTDTFDRQQAYVDLFRYHHETFLPARNVTVDTADWKYTSGSLISSYTYRCKRTITPSGRPNIPVHERNWVQSMQYRNNLASTVYETVFKWDGTDSPMPPNNSFYNDNYQSIYFTSDSSPRAIPGSGETRYKYYVSSEDSNTWMLFCNGFLIGYDFGDDTWWRGVDPNFYTTSIMLDGVPGLYMPSITGSGNPWYYTGNVRQSVIYGLPMYTASYAPEGNDVNFLITDNIYLYVNQEPNSNNTRTMYNPFIIGKNTRTDILLKCRNTISMQASLQASGAESILYNSKYYIDMYPTSATSLLLETAADEGVL